MTSPEFINSKGHSSQAFVLILSVMLLFHSIVWMWLPSYEKAIPLFELYHDRVRGTILPLLSLVLILLHLLRNRDLYFILGFVVMFLHIITGFSRATVTLPTIMLLIIFYFLFIRKPETQAQSRTAAIALTSFIMLIPAIHKINSDFLGGAEFKPGGDFVSEIYLWNLNQVGEFLSSLTFLPVLSIAIELGLAVAIWFFPAVAVHALLLFFLALSFFRPGVILIYFIFLGITSLITNETESVLKKMKIFNSRWSVVFISPLPQLLLNQYEIFKYKMLVNYPVTIFFIFIHGTCLIKALKHIKFTSPFKLPYVTQIRVWVIPTILILLYLGSYSFIPRPLAFNMFSSRKFSAGAYLLEISSKPICDSFIYRWPLLPISDTEFKKKSNSDCDYKFPTRAGLEYLTKKICKIDKDTKLKIGPLNETTEPILCEVK